MQVNEHAVVVAGGGPTGMMLAAELALAGVDVVVVERRATQEMEGSRAGGFHARTIEVLDQRGVADRFLEAGTAMQINAFANVPLDLGGFPTRHPYGLALWQNRIEELLAEWVFGELEVPVLRGREVTGFAQDDGGVDVALSDGTTVRAQYLAGCDGGRSLVRRTAGIAFPGWDASTSYIIAEVEMRDTPQVGLNQDAKGTYAIGPLGEGTRMRVVLRDEEVRTGEPTLDDLRAALTALYGTDFGVHSPAWISRFSDATRQAEAYRAGRMLLAGDAAHVHAPVGGQGLGLGVQDAVNLGWKLAQVVAGTSPEALLDTYHAERHPVAAAALRMTMAQTALTRVDDRIAALRDTIADLLSSEELRTRIVATLSGLDVHYDLGEGHPLLGRRMPDLELATADGARRVYEHLHDARAVLLNVGAPGSFDIGAWEDRVRLVEGAYDGAWELPVFGEVAAPTAVLVRPDGYVAWVGDGTDFGLADALTTWFGPPAAPYAGAAVKTDARRRQDALGVDRLFHRA